MARSGGLGRGGVRQPGSFGRRGRPVRSVSLGAGMAGDVASDPLSQLIGGLQAGSQRVQPGSATLDPGRRAPGEFQDVASAGYNQNAQRVAERGGAKQYETSVQEEQAGERSASARNQMLMALLMAMGGGALGKGAGALGRGAGGRGFPPGMMNRIKAALGSKAGTAAIDTAAFGGMAAAPVYDLIQRHGRGARPFGSADADARARELIQRGGGVRAGANWGRPPQPSPNQSMTRGAIDARRNQDLTRRSW